MRRLRYVLIGIVVVFALMQLVRFERTNPPVTGEIAAPPEVAAILRRSCYDCHSNETRWPWYTKIAPSSWLVHRDVVEGRRHLNFSEWTTYAEKKRAHKLEEIDEQVRTGEMPPFFYTPMHAGSKLTDADKAALHAWATGGK